MNITPKTKVSELLEAYPELEETLIALSPSFEKLRNPVLRKTIARVASLQQVASVGNIPIEKLINTLRKAAGQADIALDQELDNPEINIKEWVMNNPVTATLDAREMLAKGEHPLALVLKSTKELPEGGIFELITPFTPAPLIEKVKDQGLDCFVRQINDSEIRTYFYKARS